MSQAWRDYASVQTRMHNICKEVLAPRYADCTLAESTHVNPLHVVIVVNPADLRR